MLARDWNSGLVMGEAAAGRQRWRVVLALLLPVLLATLRWLEWPDLPSWLWKTAVVVGPLWGVLLWRGQDGWAVTWLEPVLRWGVAGGALAVGLMSVVNGGPLGVALSAVVALYGVALLRG